MSPDRRAALERSVLATLAFFDIFDYPLTLVEIVRCRYRLDQTAEGDPTASDILEAMQAAPIQQRHGLYFLAGRDALVENRLRRYRIAERKFARAKRAASLMRLLPSVRMIAVCNSLAISNADESSDIDLFVVCRSGTLWTTRMVIAGVLKCFGLRPSERPGGDPLCLSFFISEKSLCLESLALPEGDTYLRYWVASLVPVYDAGGVYARFICANRRWLEPVLALNPRSVWRRRTVRHTRAPRPFLSLMRRIDPLARRLQISVAPAEIRALMNRDSRVVMSEDILKFHVADRRREFEIRFREKLAALPVRIPVPVCSVS